MYLILLFYAWRKGKIWLIVVFWELIGFNYFIWIYLCWKYFLVECIRDYYDVLNEKKYTR